MEKNIRAIRSLNQMGKSWFVLYKYYELVDKTELKWKNCDTVTMRKNIYEKTRQYHLEWLRYIISASEAKLGTNKLDVDGYEIKTMACIVYDKLTQLGKYKSIEYSYLVKSVTKPFREYNISSFNKLEVNKNVVQIDDTVIWEDLEDGTEIKRRISKNNNGDSDQISSDAELARKSLGQSEGTIIIVNEIFKFKIKKIIK